MNTDWRDILGSLDLPGDCTGGDPIHETPAEAAGKQAKKPRLDLILDRKRAGKTATIIAGFPDGFPTGEIDALAADLRRRLGTGGSARGGEILIQGDRRDTVAAILEKMGYKTRKIGG